MSLRKKTVNKKHKLLLLPTAAAYCFCLLLLLTGCEPNRRIMESQNGGISSAPINSAATPVNAFESDINSMKTANFDYIYVFRRKDGGKMTADDKKFAKQNSPFDTNRFIVSDEETAIIAGSNTRFAPANLEALKSAFVVADFSKPESELNKSNTNADLPANLKEARRVILEETNKTKTNANVKTDK